MGKMETALNLQDLANFIGEIKYEYINLNPNLVQQFHSEPGKDDPFPIWINYHDNFTQFTNQFEKGSLEYYMCMMVWNTINQVTSISWKTYCEIKKKIIDRHLE